MYVWQRYAQSLWFFQWLLDNYCMDVRAEHQRIDAFKLGYWRRLLRVHGNARKSNQSILKEINPEHSMKRLMLKLKLQHFGCLAWRANSLERLWCWERLRAGREGGDRGRDVWMASLTQWTWVWANSRNWWWIGKPGVLGSQRVGHDLVTKQQTSKYVHVRYFIRFYCLNVDNLEWKWCF